MIDWKLLEAMRTVFLGESSAGTRDYWTSDTALDSYDGTFGERIGWKWDAVLADAKGRGWTPPAGHVLLDWGCGTGVGARRVLAAFGAEAFSVVELRDRSAPATAFATKRLAAEQPAARVSTAAIGAPAPERFVLVVSHVLGELSPTDEAKLSILAERAAAVLWVEPGTFSLSRRLIALRERWRGTLHPWAPCPHSAACGLGTETNGRHWCHHFAPPPPHVFTTAEWREFSTRLRIDLRSLPVSYLVADRRAPAPRPARAIGRPRVHTGYATYLRCEENGVTERKVLRKEDRELHRALEDSVFARYFSA